jgi:hypothetical protein
MTDDIEAAAIMGCTRTVRTTVDGSLIIQFEIEPRHAQKAFALFGASGTPVAMARIMPGVAQRQAQRDTVGAEKGGALCKLAAIFCNSEEFRTWLRLTYDPLPRTADDAAEIIRRVCKIESRSQLDHDPEAAATFHSTFRLPYSAWADGRR